jgi:hypothetical protein
VTAALRAIIGFEKSTKFFWFFECLVAVLRMFIERVIMLVVFLSAVRDFIANQSASSSERLGFYEAFWGIGSAILFAIFALGAVGIVNVLVMSRKEKFFSQPGTWVKPPQLFQDGRDYKNFLKLWISSIIAALIMFWYSLFLSGAFGFNSNKKTIGLAWWLQTVVEYFRRKHSRFSYSQHLFPSSVLLFLHKWRSGAGIGRLVCSCFSAACSLWVFGKSIGSPGNNKK